MTSTVGDDITTTAATSGAVDIDAAINVILAGDIVTTGAAAANGGSGGQVDINTADGVITVANITASGGVGTTAGGNGAAVNLTTADAGNDANHAITINGLVRSIGGTGPTVGTNGTVTLVADGDVVDGDSDNSTDIETGALVITARTGVGTGTSGPLEISVVSLDVVNQVSGVINLRESDDITVLRIKQDGTSINDDVTLSTTNGTITIDATGTGVTAAGGDIVLDANGSGKNLVVNDVVTAAVAGTITLSADNNITADALISSASGAIGLTAATNISFTVNGDITSTSGDVSVTATVGTITMADDTTNATLINAGSGKISLKAKGNVTLAGLLTTNSTAMRSRSKPPAVRSSMAGTSSLTLSQPTARPR